VMKVTIIQYLLLLLILPADSNVESSNMASLESGVGYLYLDTGEVENVPKPLKVIANASPFLSEPRNRCKACDKTGKNTVVNPLNSRTLCGGEYHILALG